MSSLPSLSTARLITCQRVCTGRTFSTSSIHREAIHAHGHSGSNQKSTCVRSCCAMHTPRCWGLRSSTDELGGAFHPPACHHSPNAPQQASHCVQPSYT